jgi:RecJ-like exonuclease
MKEASAEIGSGSEGGGHNIAAGATIPRGQEDQFLKIIQRILRKQMGRMKEVTSQPEESANEETIK